jgi:co-chaperonin GroES (HSP10)
MADTAPTPTFNKQILPWEDVVICTDPPEERTEEGVILPGSEASAADPSKKPEKGIVYAIGKTSDPKKKLPLNLEIGDQIFYERYTANVISDANKKYNFIRFKNIMGVKKKV